MAWSILAIQCLFFYTRQGSFVVHQPPHATQHVVDVPAFTLSRAFSMPISADRRSPRWPRRLSLTLRSAGLFSSTVSSMVAEETIVYLAQPEQKPNGSTPPSLISTTRSSTKDGSSSFGDTYVYVRCKHFIQIPHVSATARSCRVQSCLYFEAEENASPTSQRSPSCNMFDAEIRSIFTSKDMNIFWKYGNSDVTIMQNAALVKTIKLNVI